MRNGNAGDNAPIEAPPVLIGIKRGEGLTLRRSWTAWKRTAVPTAFTYAVNASAILLPNTYENDVIDTYVKVLFKFLCRRL